MAPTTTLAPRIDHLNLTVEDLDATRAWYAQVFGFRTVEEGMRPSGRWAILRAGDTMLCMYEDAGRQHARSGADDGSPHHQIRHVGFAISDVDAWNAQLEALGLEVFYGGPVPYPHSTSWYVRDPSGYEIEVVHWHDGVRFGAD